MSNICPKCGEDHDEARAFYERMDADVDAYDLAQMEAAKAEGITQTVPKPTYEKQLLDLCEAIAATAIDKWERQEEDDETLSLDQVCALHFASAILSLTEVGWDLNNEDEKDEDADSRADKAFDRIAEAATTQFSGEVSLELVRHILRNGP